MTQTERWLASTWPLVRAKLPDPPARVIELGCGAAGGHVPRLDAAGYDALGVDPQAPEGPEYRRVEFERLEDPPTEAAAIVASASLHHVEDPREVLAAMDQALAPGGRVIVVEWDWEAFDRPTADWCFNRLRSDDEGGWLHRHRDAWAASGADWDDYLRGWAREHRIHPARELLTLLGERFRLDAPVRGPYYFADLEGTTEDDEARAIRAGEIRAARVDVVGVRR
jgi:SAM-dependent methyltransferase